MDVNNEEKMEAGTMNTKLNDQQKFPERLYQFWTERVIEIFSKANLFTICCVTAGLLLIAYLGAFSCEVSWLLEAHGDLPTPSYLLCAGYFIMFVASTILIHGLATGLPWGLFSWSVIVGVLSIPELAFVMIMTTQFWGLQSTHGLTELVGYLIRLIINCLTLLCVIPTGLKWRRESKVLTQLQTLATRLQLQTPPPTTPTFKSNSLRGSKKRRRSRRPSAYDNPGYVLNESGMNGMPSIYDAYGRNNEFNASIFGLHPGQYIGPYPPPQAPFSKRTQSLLDLRYVIPPFNQKPSIDECDGKMLNNNIEHVKNVNEKQKQSLLDMPNMKGQPDDPIYCTIDSNSGRKLARNCVSLENLEDIAKIKNDLSYGNNLLQNYHFWPMMAGYAPEQFPPPHPQQFVRLPYGFGYPFQHNSLMGCGGVGYGGFTHPYANRSNTNSKQSVGTSESDDYRKYRDVAL